MMRTHAVTIPDGALLGDGGRPYMRGRNGFSALARVDVDADRLPGSVRVELRSARWTADPPALAMLPPATARALAAALIAAADEAEKEPAR